MKPSKLLVPAANETYELARQICEAGGDGWRVTGGGAYVGNIKGGTVSVEALAERGVRVIVRATLVGCDLSLVTGENGQVEDVRAYSQSLVGHLVNRELRPGGTELALGLAYASLQSVLV